MVLSESLFEKGFRYEIDYETIASSKDDYKILRRNGVDLIIDSDELHFQRNDSQWIRIKDPD